MERAAMDDQFIANAAPKGSTNSKRSSLSAGGTPINGAPARFSSAQQLQQNHIARPSQESNTLPPINGLAMNSQYQTYSSHDEGHMQGMVAQAPITPQASSAPQDHAAFAQAPQQNGVHRAVQPAPHVSMFHQPPMYSTAPMGVSLGPTHSYSLTTALPQQPQFPPSLIAQQQLAGGRQQDPQPRHVVGQQGRRGVLPAAPNKPAPTMGGKFPIPPKNSEGKFPCPHCTKTYLHAKHLKRHMLRHTGDRPYHCKLCQDTFSRSDILKRHFQKCSIRRGVPGDTDHLEGSRAHNNRGRLSTGTMNDQTHNYLPNTNGTYDPNISNLINTLPNFVQQQQQQNQQQLQQMNLQQQQQQQQQAYADNMNSMSNRSSRSNSMMHPQMGDGSPAFDQRNGYEQQTNYNHQGMVPNMAYSMAPNSTTYSAYAPLTATSAGMNGQAVLANDSSNGMFARNGPPMGNGQEQNWPGSFTGYAGYSAAEPNGEIKVEPGAVVDSSHQEDTYSSLYNNSSTSDANVVFDGWNLGDRTQEKLAALVAFCFADGTPRSQNELAIQERLKSILTVENVNHFLELFMIFQVHWPIFHMPSFSTLQANNGLILTMVTIGAIYSDKLLRLDEVRWLMEICKFACDRSFRVVKLVNAVKNGESEEGQVLTADIEEVQALILLQIVFIWHGNKEQRHQAREEYWKLAAIARQSCLLQPVPIGRPDFSILHQPSREPLTSVEVSTWNWATWIAQEKRLRAMYLVYLMDCALVIFFNRAPVFDASELRIPLPTDDAAWEATTEVACKEALGLHGSQVQEGANQSGSRRPRQPEFDKAVKLLLTTQKDLAPRSTNIYSKFILIHALHVKVWILQHQTMSTTGHGFSPSGPTTPLSPHDWIVHQRSGQATPTDANSHIVQFPPVHQQQVQTLIFAVEKWKRAWDTDIDLQYPPSGSPPGIPSVRRVGFCRDAIHYYFMAKQFLRNNRPVDVADPDKQMTWVMKMLKKIRTFVGSEANRQNKELGSVVSVDEDYGVDDVNLDMKKLFTPLDMGVEGMQHADVRLE